MNLKLWEHVGEELRRLLNDTESHIGLIMFEKDGAVAALVAGKNGLNNARLQKSLKLFAQRAKDMAEHVGSGEVSIEPDSKRIFIRETKSGKYHPVKPEDPEGPERN